MSQILLAVQLLSLGHLLSSGHVTCLEHGDIIHVQREGTRAAARAIDAKAVASVRDTVAANESTSDADHDSCLACLDASRRFLLIGPAQPAVAHQVQVSVVHAARSVFFTPVDLILLSPKNSPPSA